MTEKLSLKDLALKGKKVLMRVDYNVPLDKEGNITDDTRIMATLPSIRYALDHGAALILMSHLGRASGKKVPELSLAPCAKRLSQLLGQEVVMAPDCIGADVQKLVSLLKPGQVILLENLRYHRAEEHPDEDPEFAKQLAALGDYYVNDAFGAAHREHASITAVPRLFSNRAAAGFLLEREIQFLGQALLHPKRPFFAILGGAKLSSKLGVVASLLNKADAVFIGGGMAFTFFKAQGIPIGNSIHEDLFLGEAKELLASANQGKTRLFLPSDLVIADSLSQDASMRIIDSQEGIAEGFQGVDIGPKTIHDYAVKFKQAATILWNGPVGVFEIPHFSKGTVAVAKILADVKATTIVGGGDSIAAVQMAGLAGQMSHISTGGGATLEYIEYGTLPGIEVLSNK